MSDFSRFVVTVSGGEPPEPEVIKCERSVSKELERLLPKLDPAMPVVFHAPVGSGKTHAIVHVLLPWARKLGAGVLYISSRVAINSQVKREIIEETGEEHLIEEHTAYGMRQQRDFDGITVITYHALYNAMRYSPDSLKRYGILVFDEIHALLEDALFVPYTGYVLTHLKEFFGTKIRIYLSATPEEILPCLVKAESPHRLTVLRFRRNFSYVQPGFFHEESEIVRRINEDKSDQKWLIYSASIKHGEQLKNQIHHRVCMLNSVTREQNPDAWGAMLANNGFAEKVAIATAVIDAGVSFTDRTLVNLVTFTTSLTTLVQVLGRKRKKDSETVRLFVWCPSMQDVNQQFHTDAEIQDAIALYDSDYAQWADRYIVHPAGRDLRNLVWVDSDGHLVVNSLAKVKLKNERNFLESLSRRAKRNHGDCGFDRLVAHRLNLTRLNFSRCWLDGNSAGKARADLEELLSNSINCRMGEAEFSVFAERFRDYCVAAYGKGRGGKDRDDRAWKGKKIKNKLLELGGHYRLSIDAVRHSYTIVRRCAEETPCGDEGAADV